MLQSAKPGLHEIPHFDDAHVATAFFGVGHAFVQLPQCEGEELTSMHDDPHAVVDPGQETTQPPWPNAQNIPVVHLVAQLPHVSGSVRSASQPSAGSPLQSARPFVHVVGAQRPASSHFTEAAKGSEQRSQEVPPHPNAGSDASTHSSPQRFVPFPHVSGGGSAGGGVTDGPASSKSSGRSAVRSPAPEIALQPMPAATPAHTTSMARARRRIPPSG
jgi:hypothetical protein